MALGPRQDILQFNADMARDHFGPLLFLIYKSLLSPPHRNHFNRFTLAHALSRRRSLLGVQMTAGLGDALCFFGHFGVHLRQTTVVWLRPLGGGLSEGVRAVWMFLLVPKMAETGRPARQRYMTQDRGSYSAHVHTHTKSQSHVPFQHSR